MWLQYEKENWTIQSHVEMDTTAEVRNSISLLTSNETNLDILDRYSDLGKLMRITALCQRFIALSKKQTA